MTDERAQPLLSIIMPVRNEHRHIGAALDAALGQEIGATFEVIVADGMSDDGTREIVSSLAIGDPRLRLLDNPEQRTPAGLNVALAAARGRYFIRLDGHTIAPAGYASRLLAHLVAGECDAVGGIKRAVGIGGFGRAVAAAHGSRFGVANARHHYVSRAGPIDHIPHGAYDLAITRAIGGFSEDLVRNQDYDFDQRFARAGGRILFDPSVELEWHVRETPRALLSQYAQYGFWKYEVLRRHPESLKARWLIPPAFVGTLVLTAALSSWRPARIALLAASSSYGGLLVLGAATIHRRRSTDSSPLQILAALAVMHLSWGTGFLISAVHGGLRVISPVQGSREGSPMSTRSVLVNGATAVEAALEDGRTRQLAILRCPSCGAELVPDSAGLSCTSAAAHAFPVLDGIPVLIDEDRSVFSHADFRERRRTTVAPPSPVLEAIASALPTLSLNVKAEANYRRFADLLLRRAPTARVLVVGGGTSGAGMEVLARNPAIELIESDVFFGERTAIICDAHDLPFADASIDGLVIQAVLEHVLDPYRCVQEVHRVLRADGLVYAETPFMQQVHVARYDFTRFTHLGHRRLFRKFSEVESGVTCGPGMALAWAYQYFLLSFCRRRATRVLARGFARSTAFWLKYLDRYLEENPGALDAASGYYFLGRKSEETLADRELVRLYRGGLR
jgi:glycosyltransferase involved in cell wall biosynthesis/SAM-dependent methyltransferase